MADFGGKGDGSFANDNAIAEAVGAAVPIILGPGDWLFNNPWPSLANTVSRSVIGFGGRSAGGAATTRIIYAGSSGPFIDATSTYGFRLSDLQILYTNAAFASKLIDLSRGSGSDTAFALIDRCTINGTNTSAGATALVSLKKAITSCVRSSLFNYAVCAIRGKDAAGDYSNRIKLDDCEFGQTSQAPIQSAAQAWKVDSCTFEPLSGGGAGAYSQPVDAANGLSFTGCWMGDADTTGTWIDFTGAGTGLVVEGNYITSGNTGVNLGASTFGSVVKGNHFEGGLSGNMAVGIAAGANSRKNNLQPNQYAGTVTTPISDASALEEQLWTLRGAIAAAGTVSSGKGFTVNKTATGVYLVSFTVAFSAAPTPTAILGSTLAAGGTIRAPDGSVGASSVVFETYNNANVAADSTFFFDATGPR